MKVYVVLENHWKDLDGYYSETKTSVYKVFTSKRKAERMVKQLNDDCSEYDNELYEMYGRCIETTTYVIIEKEVSK